jgi:hypothetical protein
MKELKSLSVSDLTNLIKMASDANDSSALFDTNYENDGGGAPRRIRGERMKYAYKPEFTKALRDERERRLKELYKQWKLNRRHD